VAVISCPESAAKDLVFCKAR